MRVCENCRHAAKIANINNQHPSQHIFLKPRWDDISREKHGLAECAMGEHPGPWGTYRSGYQQHQQRNIQQHPGAQQHSALPGAYRAGPYSDTLQARGDPGKDDGAKDKRGNNIPTKI